MQNLYERSLDDSTTDLSSPKLNETVFRHSGKPTKVCRGWLSLALVVTLGIIFIILCILTGILFGHYSTLHHEFSTQKSNDSVGYSELSKSVSNIMGDLTKLKDKVVIVGSCKVCPPEWKMIKSNCYYFSSSCQTWQRSKELCVERNGILLVIKNEFEMTSLLPTIKQQRYWIGLKRNPEDIDRWEWADGSLLTFSAWGEGEPNNDRHNEYCVEILGGHQSWNDRPCGDKVNYICKGVWTC